MELKIFIHFSQYPHSGTPQIIYSGEMLRKKKLLIASLEKHPTTVRKTQIKSQENCPVVEI